MPKRYQSKAQPGDRPLVGLCPRPRPLSYRRLLLLKIGECSLACRRLRSRRHRCTFTEVLVLPSVCWRLRSCLSHGIEASRWWRLSFGRDIGCRMGFESKDACGRDLGIKSSRGGDFAVPCLLSGDERMPGPGIQLPQDLGVWCLVFGSLMGGSSDSLCDILGGQQLISRPGIRRCDVTDFSNFCLPLQMRALYVKLTSLCRT